MRRLMLGLAVLALAGCGGEDGGGNPLLGTWQLDSVTGEELSASEKEATITLNADGTYSHQRDKREQKGKWEMSEDGKTLTITIDGQKAKVHEVIKLDATTLVIKDGNDEITFKKK